MARSECIQLADIFTFRAMFAIFKAKWYIKDMEYFHVNTHEKIN